MSLIEWSEEYSVGIEEIDNQHQKWISIVNELHDSIMEARGISSLKELIREMEEYTDFHFSAEEQLMKEKDYPEMEYHLTQHQQFKQMLKNLEEDFEEEGATRALSTSINTYLINWLINHIQKVDVEFGGFLKEKGISDE